MLLRLAHARATEQLAAALPAGLLPRHHEVLAALAESGPASQQQLAERLGINRTIMVSLIDAMEQAGLVERNRDPADRRSYALAPTAQAERPRGHGTRRRPSQRPAHRAADRPREASSSDCCGRSRAPPAASISAPPASPDAHPSALTGPPQRQPELRPAPQGVGLTPPLYGVLRTLDASGPTSQQAIAEQLGLSGTAILQTVDRLEADQLVKRRRNPTDRRSNALQLTPHGHDALRKVATALDALSAELDNTLGGPANSNNSNAS